ncbi:MAG: AbrB/MazE/SpoVT family DNA-binding domain-containing protein [Lysobacteraceae bacterium]
MSILTASAKGQVTIPVAIRRKLGIEPGTPVRFVERDGVVVLEKVETDISSLFGILKATHPMSLEDMDKAIGEAVAERFERTTRR